MTKLFKGREVGKVMLGGHEINKALFKGQTVFDAEPPAPSGGGIDENTILMFHFDKDCSDSSANKVPCVRTGIIADTVSKFGGGSLILKDNYSQSVRYETTAGLFNFRASDWTIDFWLNMEGTANTSLFYFGRAIEVGLFNLFTLDLNQGNVLGLVFPPMQTWNHWAIVRSGNKILLFLNGVKVGEFAFSGMLNDTDYLQFNSHVFAWYVDEFRVSNVARWTEDFVPPKKAYSEA